MSDDNGIRKIGPGESADKLNPITLVEESFSAISPLMPNRNIEVAITRGNWILIVHKRDNTTNLYLTSHANPSLPLQANFGMEELADRSASYYYIPGKDKRSAVTDDNESYERASVLHNGIIFFVTENEKDFTRAKETIDDLHSRLIGNAQPLGEGVSSIIRDVPFDDFFDHDRHIVFEHGTCIVRRKGPEVIFEIQDNRGYPGDKNEVTFTWNTDTSVLEYRRADNAGIFYISSDTDSPFLAQDSDYSYLLGYIGVMNSVLTRFGEWTDLQ